MKLETSIELEAASVLSEDKTPEPELWPIKPEQQEYERFIFERFYYDEATGKIELHYSLDDKVKFCEIVELPKEGRRELPKSVIDRLVFNLHLIAGISYYKTYCPQTIEVRSGVLNKEEANFWNNLYTKGLGEFFYENKIDFRGLVNFPYSEESAQEAIAVVKEDMKSVTFSKKTLVPLGGGKDSIVAAELLKADGKDFDVFNLGGYPVVTQVAKVMGKEVKVVKRRLAEELFELNDKGALNGHIPISAYIAFLTLLYAHLFDYKTIAIGNEHSANYGNVELLGMSINHQYSKSFEFEEDFRILCEDTLGTDVEYFSMLRCWNEIRIAQEFSHHTQYFEAFTSCNRNFKVAGPSESANWCNECPKCAFVFTMLAPFLSRSELLMIFDEDLFEREDLWPLFEDLLGIGTMKPFECVGTPEEVAAALWLCAVKMEGEDLAFANSPILKHFQDHVGEVHGYKESVFGWKEPHLIPDQFIPMMQKSSVLILGYGMEGKANRSFFENRCPGWRIHIADKQTVEGPEAEGGHFGPAYLTHLFAYDHIVKSPGIKWTEDLAMIADRVNSGTQLFFSGLEPSCKVIGVTGSKGKSTTASLIYEICKKGLERGELGWRDLQLCGVEGEVKEEAVAFKEVKLVGNIGEPALNHVDAKDTLFVMELSSYQLEGLGQSPDVAVFTSFFPDHLDFHGNLERYLDAKANITLHQEESGVFIYPEKYHLLDQIETRAQRLSIRPTAPFPSKLLGAHNQSNIALAIAACSVYGASKESIEAALEEFPGLPHRLEDVGTFKGIRFIDDANATTPQGTMAALSIFKSNVGCLFLGGEDRGYNFEELGAMIVDLRIPKVVIFPDTGAKMKEAILGELERVRVQRLKGTVPEHIDVDGEPYDGPEFFETTDMEKAVAWAYENCPKKKTCLLSMASPSYTLFKNFKEKGDLFQKYVRELGGA